MSAAILGTETKTEKPVKLDIDRLVTSRLLIQANSGAGKSWALRRLLEQTYGKVQQIVIDVEDEFYSLRDSFDYVLAGRHGGDCPADVRSAAMLARRLLELRVSAIIGIYELKHHERITFTRLFLEALVNAPKALWHPALIVIDEAHIFCPEKDKAESAGAVIDLMTRGRKRGYCGILATQRLSKLNKDAAAEANNKLIGRSSLDVDMQRAAKELGFSSQADQARLRFLKPGEFFAFGPAISDTVIEIMVGPVETTHPKAGQQAAATPTPPREKVAKILAQLADLPAEAAQEAQTVAELKAKIRQLEQGSRVSQDRDQQQTIAESAAHLKAIEKAREQGAKSVKVELARALKKFEHEARAMLETAGDRLEGVRRDIAMAGDTVQAALDQYRELKFPTIPALEEVMAEAAKPAATLYTDTRGTAQIATAERAYTPRRPSIERTDGEDQPQNGHLPKGEHAILCAIAQFTEGVTREQLTVLTGYKATSRKEYIRRLKDRELIEPKPAGRIAATQKGIQTLGESYRPLPSGAALREHWLRTLPEGERKILELLIGQYPKPVARPQLEEATGYKATSRKEYIRRLKARQLVEVHGGAIAASPHLF